MYLINVLHALHCNAFIGTNDNSLNYLLSDETIYCTSNIFFLFLNDIGIVNPTGHGINTRGISLNRFITEDMRLVPWL